MPTYPRREAPPPRRGLPWTNKEIARLSARWAMGYTVMDLAAIHGRSYKGICMQLEKLLGESWREWNRPLSKKVRDLELKVCQYNVRIENHGQ